MLSLIRLILQYHNPSLSIFLDAKQIIPQLYFSPYLIPPELLACIGIDASSAAAENQKPSEKKDDATSVPQLLLKADLSQEEEEQQLHKLHSKYQQLFATYHLHFLAALILLESHIRDKLDQLEQKSSENASKSSGYVHAVTQSEWNQIILDGFQEKWPQKDRKLAKDSSGEETDSFVTKFTQIYHDIVKNTPQSALNQLNYLGTAGEKFAEALTTDTDENAPAKEEISLHASQEDTSQKPESATQDSDEKSSSHAGEKSQNPPEWTQSDKSYDSDVVFPVPIAEVIEMFRKDRPKNVSAHIKYIIIDCRSLRSYQFVRLPTAIHVGSRVGYEKQKIRRIIRRFESAKGTHLTIFGTGKDIAAEQHLLQLLAMQFVARGFKHISMVKEGFMSVIKHISAGTIEYVRDENVATDNTPTDGASDQSQKSSSDSGAENTTTVATKLKELWSWGVKAASEYRSHAPIDQNTLHQNSTDQNIDASGATDAQRATFELDDSDDDVDVDTVLSDIDSSSKNREEAEKITVSLADIQENLGDECEIYACSCLSSSKSAGVAPQRYLVLGRNILMLLKPHPTEITKCVVMFHRSPRQLVRLVWNRAKHTARFRLKGDPSQVLNGDPNQQFDSDTLKFSEKDDIVGKIEECMKELGREAAQVM